MSVKESVIEWLEKNRNEFFSGEQLAETLGVSRNAVWKAIKKLQEEGYEIQAVPKKGYALSAQTDVLSKEGLMLYMNPPELFLFDTIDSTNDEGKRRAMSGSPNGTCIIADNQQSGKGRRGRAFYSPAGTGIYMSVLLRLDLDFSESVFITTATSVAVCRAIKKICNIDCEIKWVNDIYYKNKKICGILTEAVSDFETGKIDSIIVGIGVNVKTTEFPDQVADVASCLLIKDAPGVRNQLAAEIYNQLMEVTQDLKERSFMKEYKERSMVIGKAIRYTSQKEWKEAVVLDIDNTGGLVIESETEGKITLHSGEITVRLKN